MTFIVGSGQYCIKKVYIAFAKRSSSSVKAASSLGSLAAPYFSKSSGYLPWTVLDHAVKMCLNFSHSSFFPLYVGGLGTLLGCMRLLSWLLCAVCAALAAASWVSVSVNLFCVISWAWLALLNPSFRAFVCSCRACNCCCIACTSCGVTRLFTSLGDNRILVRKPPSRPSCAPTSPESPSAVPCCSFSSVACSVASSVSSSSTLYHTLVGVWVSVASENSVWLSSGITVSRSSGSLVTVLPPTVLVICVVRGRRRRAAAAVLHLLRCCLRSVLVHRLKPFAK